MRNLVGAGVSGAGSSGLDILTGVKRQMITAKTSWCKKFRKRDDGALAQIKSKQHSSDLEKKMRRIKFERERRGGAVHLPISPRVVSTLTMMSYLPGHDAGVASHICPRFDVSTTLQFGSFDL